MRASREVTELRHFFAIKTDLAAAIRSAAPEEIDFHLTELATMQMHTTSPRIFRACRDTISGFEKPVAAIRA
jgi:hypothetical protein